MIKNYLGISVLLLSAFFSSQTFANKSLTFQMYSAPRYTEKNKPLLLNAQTQKYQTLLKQMSVKPPNFAGHYVLDTVGCGGGCSFALAYNAKTGQSFVLADSFADCFSEQKGYVQNDIVYHKDSRLVIVTGNRYGDPEKCETVYYLVENDHFKQISKQRK